MVRGNSFYSKIWQVLTQKLDYQNVVTTRKTDRHTYTRG